MTLPAELAPNLPDAPGRAVVLANCATCHTPRYLAVQPHFPRKTWQAEVDKMKNVYGAPLPLEDAPKIVDYLAATMGD